MDTSLQIDLVVNYISCPDFAENKRDPTWFDVELCHDQWRLISILVVVGVEVGREASRRIERYFVYIVTISVILKEKHLFINIMPLGKGTK